MAQRRTNPKRLQLIHTCTIQQSTPAQDSYGEPIDSWANLTGHVSLPCRLGPSGGREIERDIGIISYSTHVIQFGSKYASITTKMRAVVDGVNYDIERVFHDSRNETTQLWLKVVA